MWLLKTNQKKHSPEQKWREDPKSRSAQNPGLVAIKLPKSFPTNMHFPRRICTLWLKVVVYVQES